jgi:hypothetical protein
MKSHQHALTRVTRFCLPLLLLTPGAYAQNGSAGTKGGGKGVYTTERGKKTLRLRELLDTTTCSYRSTDTLLQEFKLKAKVDAILASLFEIHPYMAYQIRKEMDQQKWCLTRDLKFIPSDDPDTVTESYVRDVQIAIREITPKIVYLDVQKLKEMPEDDRAMTLIHETAHTFLDPKLEMRNDRLRALCRAVYDHYLDSKRGSIFDLKGRTANLNTALEATSAIAAFNSVEYGQAFGQAVKDPALMTGTQFQIMSGDANRIGPVIVNDLGQTKFAGFLLANRIDIPGFPLYSQMDFLRTTLSSFLIQNDHFDMDKPIGVDDDNRDAHSAPIRSAIGSCTLVKGETALRFDSAGFMSAVGYGASFALNATLEGKDGKLLLRRAINKRVANGSILIGVHYGRSLLELAVEEVLTPWEKKIQDIGVLLKKGACNNPSAPYLKYFR